jgi:DNA invertase Pin-like site-specific DNA recombinase
VCRKAATELTDYRYVPPVDLGYAWVSTAKQDLDRQLHALAEARIPTNGSSWTGSPDRPAGAARAARVCPQVMWVHTLDRLGRTVRDTLNLNLIHDLSTRRVGVRNLADPIRIDSSEPADPMAQLAVVLLALFGQMERTSP